jgi:hypothetical protein
MGLVRKPSRSHPLDPGRFELPPSKFSNVHKPVSGKPPAGSAAGRVGWALPTIGARHYFSIWWAVPTLRWALCASHQRSHPLDPGCFELPPSKFSNVHKPVSGKPPAGSAAGRVALFSFGGHCPPMGLGIISIWWAVPTRAVVSGQFQLRQTIALYCCRFAPDPFFLHSGAESFM